MRILLISFCFPPFNSSGAVRPAKLTKYLERLGHEVWVLTARDQPFPKGIDLETDSRRVRYSNWWSVNAPVDALLGKEKAKVSGYEGVVASWPWTGRFAAVYKCMLHFPDAQIGWLGSAKREADAMLRERPFDVIFANAPPFTGLLIASALSRRHRIPWVADFRDLWTDNHNYRYPALRRVFESYVETRTLSTASGVVTVSEPLAARVGVKCSVPVKVIRNGYDPEEMSDSGFVQNDRDATFHVAYTGNVYAAHYKLDVLWRVLKMLDLADSELVVQFWGRNIIGARASARQAGVLKWTTFAPTVPRQEALRLQRQADVLLFFVWAGERCEGVYTAKLFEYLGARRPILAIGPPDSDAGRLITEHRAGLVSDDPNEIAQWLRGRLSAKLTGCREPDLPVEDLSGHTRRAQAEQLAAFLAEIVETRGKALT
jgi:glycosyltransferase involved in cell wall biosynthesis